MSAYRHLLKELVYATYLVSKGGQDQDGNPIPPQWADPIPIRCRVEDRQELIRAKSGDEVVSKTQLITETPIHENYRFWLPGTEPTDPSKAVEPLAIGSASTLDGRTRLWQVWF